MTSTDGLVFLEDAMNTGRKIRHRDFNKYAYIQYRKHNVWCTENGSTYDINDHTIGGWSFYEEPVMETLYRPRVIRNRKAYPWEDSREVKLARNLVFQDDKDNFLSDEFEVLEWEEIEVKND